MMLTELCQQASTTLKVLIVAKQHQHQRAKLHERTSEWSRARAQWTSAVEQAAWIDVSPGSVPECAKIQSGMRADAAESARRLGDQQDVARLADDPLWTRLLQSTSKATETLRAATQVTWRGLVEATERPIAPAALCAKVANIPSNRDILKRYEQECTAYERLAALSVPRSGNDAIALRAAAAACQAAVAGLSYLDDVPPAVQAFFRAVDGRTATLAHVSPDVLKWLREHGQLNDYIIRSAHA